MRDRLRAAEVWGNLGYDVKDCLATVDASPVMQAFRSLLFSRIVPCVKDIGLWGPRIQQAYADLGVLDMARIDLGSLMRADEDHAGVIDAEKRELAVRRRQVAGTIAAGAQAG